MASIRNMRTRSRLFRVCIFTLIVLMMAFAFTGCYGDFPLTHKLYDWNGQVSAEPFIQSVVMWVLLIIPAYGVAMLVDAVICNLIVFWGGDPVVTYNDADALNGTAVAVSEDGATMTVSSNGEIQFTSTEIAPGEFEMRDAQGTLVGLVHRTAAGDLELCDAQGTLLQTVSADQIAAL